MTIEPGDMLEPLSIWNDTDSIRKLASPTKILDVQYKQIGCQSGIMLKVRFLNGTETYLDADWFK